MAQFQRIEPYSCSPPSCYTLRSGSRIKPGMTDHETPPPSSLLPPGAPRRPDRLADPPNDRRLGFVDPGPARRRRLCARPGAELRHHQRNFDAQLEYVLTAPRSPRPRSVPKAAAFLNRPPADQRFLEPYSGLYFQISAIADRPTAPSDEIDLPSRSLWDRKLEVSNAHNDADLHIYDSRELRRRDSAGGRARRPAARLAGRAGASRSPRAARISTTRSAC